MKKKYISVALIAACAAFFSSCSNFLEEHPTDGFEEEDAFANENLVYLNAVANLYNGMINIMGSDRQIYDMNTFSSDEAFLPCRIGDWEDGGLWQNLFLHNWGTAFDLSLNTWNYLYEKIGHCNQAMEKLQQLLEESPEATYLADYIEEARAMRAMYYFYLLDLYGRVPLVTSTSTQMSEVSQPERSEVFEFVVSELQKALPSLSDQKSNQSGTYYGRFTKGVAYFLLAKLALNAEVYTDNNWNDGILNRPSGRNIMMNVDGQEVNAFEAVIKYVDKLTEMGYTLENDFSANFSLTNDNSNENIFTIPMDPSDYPNNWSYNYIRTRHYTHAVAFGLNGWNGSCATTEAMKVFGYGTENPDPRLELTYFAGAVYGPDGNQLLLDYGGVSLPFVYEPMQAKVYMEASDGVYVQTAGARQKKYEMDENPGSNNGELPRNDMVLYRYADAVLMKGEAKLRLGQSADDEVNQIRARVNAPLKQNVTLEDMLDERLLELAWEGWRRNDQIRFGTFTEPNDDRYVGVKHSASSLDYKIDNTGYTTVFAIHNDVLLLNPNLTQNPGY